MLFSVQFPVADSRAFLAGESGRLSRSSWPLPSPEGEFLRNFGPVRQRPRGSIGAWAEENTIIEASRALRFMPPAVPVHNQIGLPLPFRVAFRRFHFDGLAVGTFTVGLASRSRKRYALEASQTAELLTHLLHLPVSIPDPLGQPISCELWAAHKYLARLYALSSTSTSQAGLVED